MYFKLVNASSVAQPVEIELKGASSIANTGTLMTLTGAKSGTDEHNLDTNTNCAGSNDINKCRTEVQPFGAGLFDTGARVASEVMLLLWLTTI